MTRDDDDASLRTQATIATQKARGWFGRKWLELRALFGFHA